MSDSFFNAMPDDFSMAESTSMTSDIASASHLNASEEGSNVDYPASTSKKEETIKPPLFSNPRVVTTSDGIGFEVSSAGKSTITVTVGSNGVITYCLVTEFGAGFWVGLGINLGISAIALAVILSVRHFYNNYVCLLYTSDAADDW